MLVGFGSYIFLWFFGWWYLKRGGFAIFLGNWYFIGESVVIYLIEIG
jgi:hypothetical protein